MDARDSGGPRPSMQMQMQASFGAYYHRGGAGGGGGGGGGGYSVGSSSPPSVIHAPAAMRHTSSQPLPVASTPTPTPADTPTHIIPHQMSFSPAPGMGMGMGLSPSDPVKRKRGRPRKYVTDANGIPLRSSPLTPGIASPQEKRGRGSGKKAQSYGLATL